jgi:hypothetical protein
VELIKHFNAQGCAKHPAQETDQAGMRGLGKQMLGDGRDVKTSMAMNSSRT